jgi:hypothetical protein
VQVEQIHDFIIEATKADEILGSSVIQSLWSGYGSIKKYELLGCDYPTVIVKHVKPDQGVHPRGWNTDLSHQRKLKSYQVELHWYESRNQCSNALYARIPFCLAAKNEDNEVLMVLEDLDASGFDRRKSFVNEKEWQACVRWLAAFHAENLNASISGLWETGTYWHLETRPDELERMDDPSLKKAASSIDRKLKDSEFLTLVHGDAKLANFCFNADGSKVAAVDFQYVGGGCGMKDLAYFVGSCFRDEEAEEMEEAVLDYYFIQISLHLAKGRSVILGEELEKDWRPLYRVAWADFHRFMKGWSPGHWKLSDYSERVTREVIRNLSEA